MTRQELARQRQQIATGQLDVGTLFVRTRQIYLDARANAAEFDEPRLRVDALYVIVEMLGSLLNEITAIRAQIRLGEQGLAGFDADLAGLRQRYANVYRPFFDELTPPEEWTAEQWKAFEDDLEGPILLWDLKTCQERWGIEFASPACEGPDLLTALSLLHQSGAATETQRELLKSVYGKAQHTAEELAETVAEGATAAAGAIASAFGDIGRGAKDFFTSPITGKGIGWGLGLVAVVGAGYFLLKKGK